MNADCSAPAFVLVSSTGRRTLGFVKNGKRVRKDFWTVFELREFAEREGILLPNRL